MSRRVDVAVVGAGFAGLAVARALSKAGASVVVLEARGRPGGRTLSQEIGRGLLVDVGAQFAGSDQTAVLSLARELGVEVLPVQRDDGANARVIDGELQTGWTFADDTRELVDEIDRWAQTVPLEAPWEAPDAGRLDATTLASWLAGNASEAALADVLLPIQTFLTLPGDFSLLHLLFYTRSNGGFGSLVGTAPLHDSLEFSGGIQRIALGVAAELADAIVYDTPVRRISSDEAGVVVAGDALTVAAKRVVVTCPATLATAIEFDPLLPYDRDQLMRRMPLKSVYKAQLLFERPFWRDADLSGTGRSGGLATWDSSPRDGSLGLLSVHVSDVARSRALRRLAGDQRKQAILEDVSRLFGAGALAPIGYLEHYWGDERHSRGSVAVLTPGTWTSVGYTLRPPTGRVHWAGTETASVFCGQVEGAIRSGTEVAAEVLEHL